MKPVYIIAIVIGFLIGNQVHSSEPELECLTENIYHEARGEPVKGQIAVAAATLNRVMNRYYANTVCEVVYTPRHFSWTEENKSVSNTEVYKEIKENIAEPMLRGMLPHAFEDVIMFHAVKVYVPSKQAWVEFEPYWAEHYELVAIIGNHVFYK